MGKKSLIKSTTKKKTASPKKSASKQSAPSAKTDKPAEKKAATAKKPAAPAAPPKPARKKQPVSELLKLSFETWSPDKLYAPPADASGSANYTAPPFFDGTSQEIKTVKALLAVQFDLTAARETPAPSTEEILTPTADKETKAAEKVPEAPTTQVTPSSDKISEPKDMALDEITLTKSPAPASPAAPEPPQEPPRKAVPVSELLKLSFGTWSPDKLYAPPADAAGAANYTAPPFFDETSEKAETVKALLARQFDLNAPPDAPEAPADAAKLPAEEIITAPEIPPAEATPIPGEKPAPAETAAPEKSEAIPEPKVPVEAPAASELKTASASEAPAEPATPPAQKIVQETTPVQETATAPVPEPEKDTGPVTSEKSEANAPETPSEPAPETEPYFPPASPVCAKPPVDGEPPNNALRMLIGCLAVIFGILMIASVLNSSKYYLQPTAAGLEIWRGKFSPSGKTLVATVPDAELSIPVASIYTREDAMTVVYDYYMREAAKRSTVIGEPDFKAITGLYEKAKKYAPTAAQAGIADARLKTITAQSLIIAADEAIVEITPQNIDKSLALLHEAASLATDRTQQQLIRLKIDELTAMKAEKAEKETGATPAAP
jgi:hypothetical protein